MNDFLLPKYHLSMGSRDGVVLCKIISLYKGTVEVVQFIHDTCKNIIKHVA